jgi:carboxyl-terminal processing protease
MTEKHTKKHTVVSEHTRGHKSKIKHLKTKFLTFPKIKITPALMFISIALTAAVGYVAGTYNYQIMAAIGPVFGYKAHSGSIDLSSLQKTYTTLAANFDGKLDTKLLIEGANRGMVAAAGDEYTVYMSLQESIDFNNGLSGNIGGGIGAEIGLKNNEITIIRPLKDNPAIRAGLIANDVVIKVNDELTTGWTVEKAVGLIRGEEGTTVKLTIRRDGEIKDYTLTRETINNPSVESNIVGELGILTISRFDDKTGSLVRAVAQEFKKQNVKSIILDLRNNGGGYVDAAKDVASLWLEDKVVVQERSGSVIRDTIKSGSNAPLKGIPTVVIVNGGTASASEIVAGALQDHGAAKLVGERTFGKGSVQQPIDLGDGSLLKVTIAKWYTPNGKNINNEGITPTTVVTYTQADVDKGVDTQMDEAKKLLNL